MRALENTYCAVMNREMARTWRKIPQIYPFILFPRCHSRRPLSWPIGRFLAGFQMFLAKPKVRSEIHSQYRHSNRAEYLKFRIEIDQAWTFLTAFKIILTSGSGTNTKSALSKVSLCTLFQRTDIFFLHNINETMKINSLDQPFLEHISKQYSLFCR